MFAPSLDALSEAVGGVDGWAVDIPIGLASDGRRAADVEARAVLGVRRSSVFHTPVRAALEAPTHAQASAISRELTGHGIGQQAYALAPKIFQAERWAIDIDDPVWEVHPEVSFTIRSGLPTSASKMTWAGMSQRRGVLEDQGIGIDDLGDASAMAGTDDVLDDACGCRVECTASRQRSSTIVSRPLTTHDEVTGRDVAIWA